MTDAQVKADAGKGVDLRHIESVSEARLATASVATQATSRFFLSGAFQVPISPPSVDASKLFADRFELKREVHRGRHSVVHLAYDQVRRCDVALKIASDLDDDASPTLAREAHIARCVGPSENLIRVYDFFRVPQETGEKLTALSIEYANGGSLRDWLSGCVADLNRRRAEGLAWFRQACLGVIGLHANGIVHLDLKPENLLIASDLLKVADFGAALITPDLVSGADLDEANDHCPWLLGTPQYMSPEQFLSSNGCEVDERSDVFSLGVLLWEILAPDGGRPFAGSYDRIRRLHEQQSTPPLPSVGAVAQEIVTRCLMHLPDERFQSVEELSSCIDLLEEEITTERTSDRHGDMEASDAGLWEGVRQRVRDGAWHDAEEICRSILESSPSHEGARDLLARLCARREQADQLYRGVEDGIGRLGSVELLELMNSAITIYRGHPKWPIVAARMRFRIDQFSQLVTNGKQAFVQGCYSDALCLFRGALRLNPGAVAVEGLVARCETLAQQQRDLRCGIDQALIGGEYQKALLLARVLDRRTERGTRR